ncbi:hypothetical protein GCM10023342_16690 [Modicisalibacter zincidurans]|uniref:Uncharacterized protein n=1 Tax=Modicisalibacter zincidurans TaxID=1178777 RepID=A0ABP9RBZ7_9GAMM
MRGALSRNELTSQGTARRAFKDKDGSHDSPFYPRIAAVARWSDAAQQGG